ncbi:cysteine hydrolase family protein [Uniformispora flossi]|uniref:cysteine hydrolase family protein n=1 Tax=Uniformispora flossi TaxID=3390723 RepID=UPI003C2BA5EB
MTAPATALLVMDLQRNMTANVTDPEYLPRVARAIGAARGAEIPVLYVVVGFRPGHPEVSPDNLAFARLRGQPTFTDADPGAEIHPDVAPRDGELVVAKKRYSAFAGNDLDMLLRSAGIRHLVLTGISTSGVVLSTLRQAADLDYRLTVLADACFDPDPEVHAVLTGKLFPRQAAVVDAATWAKDPTGSA